MIIFIRHYHETVNMKSLNDINELRSFQSLDLIARQVVEGFITGLHKSPFHGFSVEFAEHRLSNTGDSISNIDWTLYGRTDKILHRKRVVSGKRVYGRVYMGESRFSQKK